MDEQRAREIVDLLNGEGLCARCGERPIGSVFYDFTDLILGFCGVECKSAFVRGVKASGTLRAS